MNKIYEKYDDLHVVATRVYAKANDAYVYADAGTTVKIEAAVLNDIFVKGMIIVAATVEYKPTSFVLSEGVGTVTYVTADATTATTAVLAVLKSKEYVAG